MLPEVNSESTFVENEEEAKYRVEILLWWEEDGYSRRKMDDLDACCGVTNPSCVSRLNPYAELPWLNFRFDFRDNSATSIQDVSQLFIGADIGVDDFSPGCIRRDHGVYIGRPDTLPHHFHSRVPDTLLDVPCVVHVRRSEINTQVATICISSLAAFRQGLELYEYHHDRFDIMMSVARAMHCVTGRECPYDWHHASSGHWASWCVNGNFACKEADIAQKKMFGAFNLAVCAAGVFGVAAWAAVLR